MTLEPLLLALTAAPPIVIGAWRAPHGAQGQVWGAAALLGGALASLLAGTGGLEREAWRGYALAVPGGQGFVAAGAGAALAAAVAAAGTGAWRLAAAPHVLLLGLGLRGVLVSPATLLGAAIVIALLAFGAGLGRHRATPLAVTVPAWAGRDQALLIATVLAVVLGGPIILAMTALVALVWRTHAVQRSGGWWVLPALVTLLAGGLSWLLLTVAGTPWAMLGTANVDIPLSAAAERLVGNLWVALVLLAGGSWPLARRGLAMRTAPAGIALAFAGGTMLSPDGIGAWLPLATLLLVPAALIAAARRDLPGLVGAVASLAALLGGLPGLGAALLLLAWPLARSWGAGNTDQHDRVTLHVVRVGGALVALGLALAPLVILPEEVVLGTLLVAGLGLLLPAWGRAAGAR